MQFYDATNGQGICQEIDRLCDTTDTTYTRKDKTSRVNQALETVVGWIITSDGTWQFDDDNYTTLPRGTANLTSGQGQYSFATKFLSILEVDVKDTLGTWRRLQPLDPDQLGGLSVEEFFGTTSGLPVYYDPNADGLTLYPAPSSTAVTLTAGLRVRFQRTASLFTVATDTSADSTTPGFASPFHVILAYMAALPYCMTYKKDRIPLYQAKVQEMKRDLLEFYARRERDKRKVMTMKQIPGGFI